MAIIVLPSSLARRAGGRERIAVVQATAGDALRDLERRFPEVRGWIFDERGRLREHLSVFVNDQQAPLERPLATDDEVWLVRAISGGMVTAQVELLAGTKKGLIVLRGTRGGRLDVAGRVFAGQVVDYACRDPRSGRYFAAASHGQYGPHLFWADDPLGDWTEAEGPSFPPDADAAVSQIWVIEPGVERGVLWAGVAPAALFRSEDDGATWDLNRALWDEPTRARWEGGLGGLCLHSICPWPEEPHRLAVGISAAGVWLTVDGGRSWTRGVAGLVPRYVPEEARADTLMHCVHKMLRCPMKPARLYMQYHGGIYRSDDGGRAWTEIASDRGLPSDFGFPLVLDPKDPDRAFVIPLNSDEDRVTAGARLRVWETRDRGGTWQALERGMPQQDAYLTVLRQAFCDDGRDPLGLYFGCRTGEIFASADGGASWTTAADRLPPVHSLRCSA